MVKQSLPVQDLIELYFKNPQRQVVVSKDQVLLRQGQFNNRLYYLIKGSMTGTVTFEDEDGFAAQHFLFKAMPHTFMGLYSFFSKKLKSPSTVIADTDSILNYIDLDTEVVDPEQYGNLEQQFMPIIIEELSTRQMRLIESSHAREVALKTAQKSQELATLGQLSAGVAHELNNAMSIIEGNYHYLYQHELARIEQQSPDDAALFNRGILKQNKLSHHDIRQKAKQYAQHYGIDTALAKKIVPLLEDSEQLPSTLPKNIMQHIDLYEKGTAWHDLHFAASHAMNILKSIKLLSKSTEEYCEVNLAKTVDDALILLSYLREDVVISQNIDPTQMVYGNSTELVQVWVNLIKNALEAQHDNAVLNPYITIEVVPNKNSQRYTTIVIRNNGPDIPSALVKKIFQISFTTKNSGKNIGLGLGLTIVSRIIYSHRGRIKLISKDGLTSFYIYLPKGV